MIKKDIFTDAVNLQREAKKIGLDWIDIEGIIEKIYEETKEVEEAIQSNENEKIREELGDLLFTYISLARHLDINLHQVIEEAELKFSIRFSKVKSELAKSDKNFATPDEMVRIWDKMKKSE
tara:strand:+ start:400 stop:765 length:366 start_codon:yes stop_codon:yes gene_type:complete